MTLFRSEQALGEGPLLIDPLRLAAKASSARHLQDLLRGIFVAALGPDGLSLANSTRRSAAGKQYVV